MKIFITGAAGYIGYEVVRYLDQQNDVSEIVAYDNLMANRLGLFMGGTYKFRKVTFVKGDILDDRTMVEHMKGAELVIHLAARVTAPFTYEDAHLYDQTNKWGTEQVCQAIETTRPSKVIYLSSGVVYASDGQPHDVSADPLPNSPYARSKYSGEKILQRIAQQSDLYILRAGNVFGVNPSMRFDTVINRFAFDAITHNRVMLFGTGEEIRPFLSTYSLVQWFDQIYNQSLSPGIYNLVDFNAPINEILFHFRTHFQNLEYLAMNQDYKIPSIAVEPSGMKTENSADSVEKSVETFLRDVREFFTL